MKERRLVILLNFYSAKIAWLNTAAARSKNDKAHLLHIYKKTDEIIDKYNRIITELETL